nr:MAK10-like protein [Tanacetum cinerariifolium]
MGDENHIRTLRDYSKPSHEGYRDTIELPVRNNVDPSPQGRILLSDSLPNSFHRERPQNSSMISSCSNNIMKNFYPKHGLVSRTYYKKSLIMASTFGSKSNFFMTMSISSQDEPLTNRPVRDFAKSVKALALPQDVPSTSDRRLIEVENQVQCLMEAHLTPTQPTQVNKITTSCKIYSGPHDTQYCMDDFEQAYVDYASLCANEIRGKRKLYGPKSIAAINHVKKEELRKKGIKSLSKLFSLKYLALASIKELNENPSAPKRVHFVNSIVTLSKESDTEEDVSSTNVWRHNLDKMTGGNEEVKEQGKEGDEMETDMEVEEVIEEKESEFETDEEVKEILKEEEEDKDDENLKSFPTMKELSHHQWLLKNPRP